MKVKPKIKSLKASNIDKYSLATHMLTKVMISPNSPTTDQLLNSEEIEAFFDQAFLHIQDNDPLAFFDAIFKISHLIADIDYSVIQSIDISSLDILIKAIDAFSDNEDCIYITLYCISVLSDIEKFRNYFFSNDIFQKSLDALYAENEKISYNALRVVSTLIKLALINEAEFDIDQLFEILDDSQCKSRDHEYFVILTLRSIAEFSETSVFSKKIIDVLCSINLENSQQENLADVAETVHLILKKDFNYNLYSYIHHRSGITGILLEQLNENTIETFEYYFPIPVLRIILCVINNLKEIAPNEAIQFAKLVSYEKYEELIRKSIVEVAELALQVFSFLLIEEPDDLFGFCMNNQIIDKVMIKFIDEAPFSKKSSGIKFLLAMSEVIQDANNLDFLLSFGIIDKCSFCLDGDICEVINDYLALIIKLLNLSLNLKAHKLSYQIIDEISQLCIVDRASQVAEIFETDEDFESSQLIIQKIKDINELIH